MKDAIKIAFVFAIIAFVAYIEGMEPPAPPSGEEIGDLIKSLDSREYWQVLEAPRLSEI